MSPEQVEGKEVDRRSDLFSLGIVLYELISGRAPFKRDNEGATLKAIIEDFPEPLARFKSNVPDEFQRTVSKLLEKDPSMRYQTAASIISDLKKILKELEFGISSKNNQPSIAVLPFANLSTDPEQEYFCDGITEEIINALTHVKGLRVVARTSCFVFKGKRQDVREIGQKLNVETILEGTVRKAGNKLRISTQLISVSDGYHLWSERFDREMEDVFAIQDEISLTVVDKLKFKLLSKEKAAVIKRSSEDYEAFNLFLMGRFFSGKKTEDGLRKSIECFGRAIELDPEFSLAYSGLGYSYLRLGLERFEPCLDAFRDARVKAIKAIALDDLNSLAHALLAETYMWGDFDWAGAEREFERVLAINPSDAAGLHGYAHLMELLGRPEKSIEYMRRALQFEPLSIEYNTCLGQVLYHAKRYDDAIDRLQKVIEMDPNFSEAYNWLVRAFIHRGLYSQALKILGPLQEQSIMFALTGYIYAITGKRDEAKSILRNLKGLSQDGKEHHYNQAIINLGLGKKDEALEALEKSLEVRSGPISTFKVDPILDSLRTNTRFKKLLKKVNLE